MTVVDRLSGLVTEFARARIRTDAGAQSLDTISRRVQKVDTRSLIDWTDSTIAATGRAFDDFRTGKSDLTNPLGEAALAAASLVLALEELQYRIDHPED